DPCMPRFATIALGCTALALVAAAGYSEIYPRLHPPLARTVVPRAPSASAQAAPPPKADRLVDPFDPERPILLDTSRVQASNWVKARPAFQYSRKAVDRDGVEPCAGESVDTQAFNDWVPLAQGHFSSPKDLKLDSAGRFELVVHLNGDEPVRKQLVKSGEPFVLFTLTLDPSRGYAPLFTGTRLYQAIVSGVEQGVSKQLGSTAHVGHVAMSAWSAGFVGIAAALGQPSGNDFDAVVLIDGLHAPRNDTNAFTAQLKPFVDYAKRATAGERLMFITHSSIDPPDFASTTECAHYLVASLGGKPQAVRRADPWGLELVEYFARGDLQVRGYAGNDKADHCAQLVVLRDAFAALGKRWGTTATAGVRK
ncbi:MAG: hypothetical protein ABW061_03780, partial [Polyangiaceae bacterium]